MQLETVWTGAAGWLLAGLPTRGHLLAHPDVLQVARPEPARIISSPKTGREATQLDVLYAVTAGWSGTKEIASLAAINMRTASKWLNVLALQGDIQRRLVTEQVTGKRWTHVRVYYRRAQ